MIPSIYDVQRLRAWHAHVAALADVSAPKARVIVSPHAESCGNVAVVAGSFNPATNAHLSLCDGALRQPDVGVVWLSLAVHTVDKEQVTGATLEDRLCMLEMLVDSRPNVGVVLCNRGLYVEQAEALQRLLVSAGQELVFVVGFDKILQILDPRYYADRAASLDTLFGLARFLVAKRGPYGAQALDDLLALKANRPYRERIAALTTLPAYHDPAVSSTSVRTTYVQGAQGVAGGEQIPIPVRSFIAATGVYEPPLALPSGETIDRYALRSRLRDALLAEPSSQVSASEFHAAFTLAATDSEAGRTMRRLLVQEETTLREVRRLVDG